MIHKQYLAIILIPYFLCEHVVKPEELQVICYICGGDPTATVTLPEALVTLAALGFPDDSIACGELNDLGQQSLLFESECAALIADPTIYPTCGCSAAGTVPSSTAAPIAAPVATPVVAPTTPAPVVAPVTPAPVVAPVTPAPIIAPVTPAPVLSPLTPTGLMTPAPVIAPSTPAPIAPAYPTTSMPLPASVRVPNASSVRIPTSPSQRVPTSV